MSSLSSRTAEVRRGPRTEAVQGGAGPPLIWLHGLKPPTPDDPVLEALAASNAVTAPIMPGQTGLEALHELPTIHDLVLYYDSLLEGLGVERALIVGHSFGAMLAAELAALNPRRARGLVLIAPLGLWNDAHPIEDLFARPYGEMDELIWAGAIQRPPQPDPETRGVEDHLAMVNALGSVANYAWPIPDRGLRGRLYRIEAPTFLLFAKSDALLPTAYANDFQQELAQSFCRIVEGGHMWPYEDPEETARVIGAYSAGLT
jgi:pimeloyl-ACP methyl ester carboxylesterase